MMVGVNICNSRLPTQQNCQIYLLTSYIYLITFDTYLTLSGIRRRNNKKCIEGQQKTVRKYKIRT